MPHLLFIPTCLSNLFHQIMSSFTISATHSSTFSFQPISNHPQYYLPGGDLYIITKAVWFHIHKYFFKRESVHFQTIFEITPLVGSSPNFTLDLSDMIKPDELELFLSVMYNPKYNIYNLSIGQWFDIQSYASIWQFPEMYALTKWEIKNLRIKEMNNPVATKMFRAYEIWQHERYHQLLNRIYEEDSKWDQGSQPSVGVMLCCLSLGIHLAPISLSLPYSHPIVLFIPRITLYFHLSWIPWSPCDPYPMPCLCLLYFLFLSFPSLTHPASCTLVTFLSMPYSSLSYSSFIAYWSTLCPTYYWLVTFASSTIKTPVVTCSSSAWL